MNDSGPWQRHARQWNWVGPPLRPSAEDVRGCCDCLADWHAQHPLPESRGLLLGVTPELVAMDWPSGSRVLAVDHAFAMVAGVWPGPRRGQHVACGDWLALPVADGSVHMVVGDASYNALPTGDHYPAMTAALRRAMHEEGVLVLRFFARPARAESLAALGAATAAGDIANFNILKWRLAMALHGSLAEGVRLADIWEAWHAMVPDPVALFARQGWPIEVLGTIDAYRGVQTCYTFPTLAEARAALTPAFVEQACRIPDYEFGECCPRLVLRPR